MLVTGAEACVREATSIDPELTEQLMAVFPTVGQVGAAYLQNGVDHGSLRPDLDVAATADDITGMMLAAVIGSLSQKVTWSFS